MHVLAFIVITASLVANQKRGYLIVTLTWFTVDVLFETAQFWGESVSRIIPDFFSNYLFLENTKDYFLQGRFDYLDLLSIALGSMAAYILLIKTREDLGENR